MALTNDSRCFACDRKLGQNPYPADTRDAQWVYVGTECYKRIKAAGDAGYQPPLGGPRLYFITREMVTDKTGQSRF